MIYNKKDLKAIVTRWKDILLGVIVFLYIYSDLSPCPFNAELMNNKILANLPIGCQNAVIYMCIFERIDKAAEMSSSSIDDQLDLLINFENEDS